MARRAGSRRKFDVFLAYNARDDDVVKRARAIYQALEGCGLRTWFGEEDARTGEPSTEVMTTGLERSRCCAMLHGEKGLGRWQSAYELELAVKEWVEHRKRFFPVLLPGSGDIETLPKHLQLPTALDLREEFADQRPTEEGLLRLEAAARGLSPRELRERRIATEGSRGRPSPGAQAPGTGSRRNRALLVGVSGYTQPELKRLHGPRQDIEQLKEALEEARMPSGREWEVTLCPDPTIDTLTKTLWDFFSRKDAEGDTVLFYYSGHGLVQDDAAYICATDTQPDDPYWTQTTAFPAERIVKAVEASAAAATVIILDCCHAAPIHRNSYEALGADVAVIASQGLAEDAKVVSEPSAFTRSLVGALRDPAAYGPSGLSVGDLLAELERQGESPWTNPNCNREILLAAGAGRPALEPEETAPEIAVEISAEAVPQERLPLLCQLAATLEELLAVAQEEGQIPSSVVDQTTQVLADELRRLALTPDQLRDLSETLRTAADAPATCAVRFVDAQARARLEDVPWEYLALPESGIAWQELAGEHDAERTRAIVVARQFDAPPTKQARRRPQQIALFSSCARTGRDPLTAETEKQLKALGMSPAVTEAAEWNVFRGAPDDADLVILQTPVTLVENRVEVLFAAEHGAKPVPDASVARQLKRRRNLVWLVIETVADGSQSQPALALRRLVPYLAAELGRAVVGVCHPRAYLKSREENPDTTAFAAALIAELAAGSSLDHAAHEARASVASDLGIRNAAIVGLPIIMHPVERADAEERQRPVARRDEARRHEAA
jgi:hypothetical protein